MRDECQRYGFVVAESEQSSPELRIFFGVRSPVRILQQLGFELSANGAQPDSPSTFLAGAWTWNARSKLLKDRRPHGFDKFAIPAGSMPAPWWKLLTPKRCATRTALLALGYHEAVSLTFISQSRRRNIFFRGG